MVKGHSLVYKLYYWLRFEQINRSMRNFLAVAAIVLVGCVALFVPVLLEFIMNFTEREAPTIHLILRIFLFILFGLFLLAMAISLSGVSILGIYSMVRDRRVEEGAIPSLIISSALAIIFVSLMVIMLKSLLWFW